MSDDHEGADTPPNEVLHLFGARLVQAGWAKRILTDKNGFYVDWVPGGRKKFAAVHDLMVELDYRSFTRDHIVGFFSFLGFEGSDKTTWK